MKKRITLVIITSLLCRMAIGQITEGEDNLRTVKTDIAEGWKKGGVVNLNFSQASFTNWAAGGENSISINGLVSVYANYKKGKSSWDNMIDLGYGVLKQGDDDLMKTDDKIDFTSKYGRQASKKWYYAALFNFKTQMAPGYDYPNDSVKISEIFAPAYILASVGMDFKPNDHFTAFFAPLTSKTTFVTNSDLADAGSYGVEEATYDDNGALISRGKKVRSEIGGYVRAVYQNTFFKDKSISLMSKIDLFSNYIENPEKIDVSWENVMGFKVNKYISATITTCLLYDYDTKMDYDDNEETEDEARVQFKEVIAIGFSYKF